MKTLVMLLVLAPALAVAQHRRSGPITWDEAFADRAAAREEQEAEQRLNDFQYELEQTRQLQEKQLEMMEDQSRLLEEQNRYMRDQQWREFERDLELD